MRRQRVAGSRRQHASAIGRERSGLARDVGKRRARTCGVSGRTGVTASHSTMAPGASSSSGASVVTRWPEVDQRHATAREVGREATGRHGLRDRRRAGERAQVEAQILRPRHGDVVGVDDRKRTRLVQHPPRQMTEQGGLRGADAGDRNKGHAGFVIGV